MTAARCLLFAARLLALATGVLASGGLAVAVFGASEVVLVLGALNGAFWWWMAFRHIPREEEDDRDE